MEEDGEAQMKGLTNVRVRFLEHNDRAKFVSPLLASVLAVLC